MADKADLAVATTWNICNIFQQHSHSAHFCHCASFNVSLILFFTSLVFEINDHAKQYMSDEFEFCKGLVGVNQLGSPRLKI